MIGPTCCQVADKQPASVSKQDCWKVFLDGLATVEKISCQEDADTKASLQQAWVSPGDVLRLHCTRILDIH